MPSFPRIVLKVFLVSVPLAASVWVVCFYGFCLRVYWAIGKVPLNKHDRLQAHLENGLHDVIVGYGLIALFLLFVPWSIAYAVAVVEKVATARLAYLLPLGWAAMGLVFLIDPWHLFWDVYFD